MATEQTEIGTEVATVGERAVAQENGAPGSLVQLAIEKGVDVGVIERLVALQERHEAKAARAAFFEAVAAFQEQCPEIPKSKTASIATKSGSRYSYTFSPLESITRTIRPHLKEHGLSYSWDVVESNPQALNVVCVLRHVDGHEERATFPVPTATDAGMSAAQKNGAALTYGKRQSLLAVLGLTTADDDTDGADPVAEKSITKKQASELNDIADRAGADVRAFCEWLNVPSIAEIPASQFEFARQRLEAKLPKEDS